MPSIDLTVWSDWEGFTANAKLYEEHTGKLSGIARSGDKEAFKTQWKVVCQTCETCHTKCRKNANLPDNERTELDLWLILFR